jgi:hypothetical protein
MLNVRRETSYSFGAAAVTVVLWSSSSGSLGPWPQQETMAAADTIAWATLSCEPGCVRR